MIFTIDTTNKVIKLSHEIIIDELLKELEEMNIDFTEYKLSYIPYSNPYVVGYPGNTFTTPIAYL